MGASREHCGGVLRVTHVCLRVRVLGVSLNAKLWLLGTQLEMQKCDDSLNPKRARRKQFQQPGSGWDTIFPDGVLSCNPARMAWRHAPRTTWYVLQRLARTFGHTEVAGHLQATQGQEPALGRERLQV